METRTRKLLHNWQEEKEAALLYRKMAAAEPSEERRGIFLRLAEIEDSHASLWQSELESRGFSLQFRPGLRARLLGCAAIRLGSRSVLDALERDEGRAVGSYSGQVVLFPELADGLKTIVAEEKSHGRVLAELRGKPAGPLSGERWHQGGSSIRDLIFGVNDGLLSTFSLVTGVAGGTVNNGIILLSGLAGAIAGAISMAAGAYISTKSEREVLERHLTMERAELDAMPDAERDELRLMYELKGVDSEQADAIADHIMANRDTALETMAREEMGFSPDDLSSPVKAAIASGLSFVAGAALPILPLLFVPGRLALVVSGALSMFGFFIIGAGRTVVTGRNAWRSGFEMFVLGALAASVTYGIGRVLGVSLAG